MPKTIVADLEEVCRSTESVLPTPKTVLEVYVRRFLMPKEFARSCAAKHTYSESVSIHVVLKHFLNLNDGNAWAFQYEHVVSAVGMANAPQVWSLLRGSDKTIELDASACAEPVNLRRTYQAATAMPMQHLKMEVETRGTAASFAAAVSATSWMLSTGTLSVGQEAHTPMPDEQSPAYAAPNKPAVPARATFSNHTKGEAFGAVSCEAPTTISRKRP